MKKVTQKEFDEMVQRARVLLAQMGFFVNTWSSDNRMALIVSGTQTHNSSSFGEMFQIVSDK